VINPWVVNWEAKLKIRSENLTISFELQLCPRNPEEADALSTLKQPAIAVS
jgi:hypothetical protein